MAEFDTREKIQASIDSSPFNAFCGFEVSRVDKKAGRLIVTMPMKNEFERMPGSRQMHGGPIACLIDTAGCYASMLVLGHGVPTINFRTDYIRPVIDSDLKAIAVVRKAGRTVAVADVDVYDGSDRLVATGRATFSSAAG
ncbi:MAG: PaaI family thioesterase [Gammaproteobacteria bacterium]|nr:PaaI family thioesterase [Gammaproteobacteria bacterium]